jgi:hypothetical protein
LLNKPGLTDLNLWKENHQTLRDSKVLLENDGGSGFRLCPGEVTNKSCEHLQIGNYQTQRNTHYSVEMKNHKWIAMEDETSTLTGDSGRSL